MQDTPIDLAGEVVATILLVDDQAIIGEAVRRVLSAEKGFSFHFCSDASQALAKAVEIQPTVILQDLVMPQSDGLTLVRDYRAEPATASIPIIVLSTKEDPKIKSAAFAAGANDYLVKLPDSLEMIARIRYHSRSYMALRQRDEATKALQLSQKHLLQTHQELQVLLDTVPTGILKLDGMGRILQGNHAAQVLLRKSEAELNGLAFNTMLALEARKDFLRRLLDIVNGSASTVSYTEADLPHADGSSMPIEYLITLLPTTQGVELTLVMRDITERKAVDKAKSEFFATVSHELRTPLTSIRGSLGMILSGKFGELPEKVVRMLDVANRNSDHLGRLINDILDLEKIAMGGMEFNITAVEADLAMDTALSANEGYALRHNVRLQVGQRVEGACINADEVRLQQVFANLISNAIKYSPAEGSVELTACLADGLIRFGVRDHGPGIPEEFRGRIFNRFSQATGAKSGTGLGLNIARSIVEHLGGRIGFDTSSAGTEFYFYLPSLGAAPAGNAQ